MTYVTRLASNVKHEPAKTVELAARTLVIGPNRSGKSALVDSLALVLTGVPRTEGLGKRPNEILSLKPPEAKELTVSARLSDGTTLGWACKGSTAKASKPVWSEAASGVFILEDAKALLQGDQKKLRAALLARLGATVDANDIWVRIPDAFLGTWQEVVGVLDLRDSTPWPIDKLLDGMGKIDDALREARKTLKALTTASGTELLPLSPEEAQELATLAAATAQTPLTPQQINELAVATGRLRESIMEQQALLDGTTPPDPSPQDQAVNLGRARDVQAWVLAELRARGLAQGRCVCCGTYTTIEQITGRAAELQALCAKVEGDRLAVVKYQRAAEEIEASKARLAGLEERIRQSTIAGEIDRDRFAALQHRSHAYEAAIRAKEAQAGIESRVAILKALREPGEALVAAGLDEKVAKLRVALQRGLPRGMTGDLALRDGNRQVCRVTLDGRDIRALSGAERAIMLAAFASAIVRDDDPAVRLLVIDDVWLDGVMLSALLETLSGVEGPTQIVVCAAEYEGVVPVGWGVLKLGDGDAACRRL